jgi:hypothetical protein
VLQRRPVLFRVLALGLSLSACAEAAASLPRLRARGWIGVSASNGTSVGGELGLVVPLDPVFSASVPDEESDEPPEPVIELVRAPAPCRVVVACGWERAESARALARLEEGTEP